ncbi:hypothetical protein THAOC_33289, partial [Thalassiosira oceanica]
ALGGKQAAHNGLSLVEDAARQQLECATEWERSCLPKYDDEGWIELYHHLLMLRSKLTFDQLLGINIQYGADQSIVRAYPGHWTKSSALCSNHVMRSGRHFAYFTALLAGNGWSIGLVRPVQLNRSDFDSPTTSRFCEYLIGQKNGEIDRFRSGATFGLLLDLKRRDANSIPDWAKVSETERWAGGRVLLVCSSLECFHRCQAGFGSLRLISNGAKDTEELTACNATPNIQGAEWFYPTQV